MQTDICIVKVKIDETAEIDYALLEAPKFTSSYMETEHKVRKQCSL